VCQSVIWPRVLASVTFADCGNVVSNNLFVAKSSPPCGAYPHRLARILSLDRARVAKRTIRCFPKSRPTRLLSLDEIAAQCQVESVQYKDESNRLGLTSFKALGAPYALVCVARARLERLSGEREVDLEQLIAGGYRESLADFWVAAATDGNHGLALAWAARQLGCQCRIYLHENASPRLDLLFQHRQAEVIRVAGNYDDSVDRCQADAEPLNHIVISDTSYDGYLTIPRRVMEGYALLCLEAFEQLDRPPTHIFVQSGVGSLAASVLAAFWARYQPNCPHGVIVEPQSAGCFYASAMRQQRTTIAGEHPTIMDGLACGEPSILAWEVISQAASAYIKVPDQVAADAVKALSGQSVSAGPSGAAGLAGLMQVAGDEACRTAISLDQSSRVFLIGTEAARTIDR
jgi:diaminopropionate ammonia-lyase